MSMASQSNLGRSALRQTVLSPGGSHRGILVYVFLRGGMDGLHSVPPHGDPGLYEGRPTLAIANPGKSGGALDLDGRFGLHPDLKPLLEFYQSKSLAIVHAAGSPDKTLSHFEAMQTAERGVYDGNDVATGWIARHLISSPLDQPSALRAVAIGEMLPKSMDGAIGAAAFRSVSEYRLRTPAGWSPGFASALTRLYTREGGELGAMGRETLKLAADLEKLSAQTYQPAGGARYPATGFGDGLKETARLIKADLGLEIAQVDLGGWDAHAAQVPLMNLLMTDLAGSLQAFFQDLGDRAESVTLVAMSEFGRRVHENAVAGTDHGRATAMLLLGAGVRGGKVYGKWPGLRRSELDRDGNVRVTTDYRDVLSELVRERLGNPNSDRVFPNYTANPVGLFAG